LIASPIQQHHKQPTSIPTNQKQEERHERPLLKRQRTPTTATAIMCQCQCPDLNSNNISDNATPLVSDFTAGIIMTAAVLLYLSYKMLFRGVKAGLESALFDAVWLIGRLVGIFDYLCQAAYRDLTALA
jgi:hypothetical protein